MYTGFLTDLCLHICVVVVVIRLDHEYTEAASKPHCRITGLEHKHYQPGLGNFLLNYWYCQKLKMNDKLAS